jgi:hypothetical protein
MPDLRLRRLERQASDGDVNAGAEVLRARLRQGTLELGHLQLAAHLGDPRACAALGDREPVPFASLELLLRRATIFGQEPWVRASLAAATVAADVWEAPTPSAQRSADGLLAAAYVWVESPNPKQGKLVATLATRLASDAHFLKAIGRALSEDESASARWARRGIRDAATLAGEAPVREAITQALIAWALDKGL